MIRGLFRVVPVMGARANGYGHGQSRDFARATFAVPRPQGHLAASSRCTTILAVSLLLLAMPARAAHNSGGAITVGPEAATNAIPSGKRSEIQRYLIDQLRDKGVSLDLVSIIMARLDAFAGGRFLPEYQARQPAMTSYPSIALQIEWQLALEEVASDFNQRFPTNYRPRPGGVAHLIEGVPTKLPEIDEILWFAPEAIKEAQGAFSEELNERALIPSIRGLAVRSKPRRHLGHFALPVRIAPTEIAVVDAAIPALLAELRTSHPDAKLDENSFPSPKDGANLIIPERRYGSGTVSNVAFCIRDSNCRSLSQLARPSAPGKAHIPMEENRRFLDSLYFSNPFGGRRAPRTLIQLNKDGTIAASFCSLDDIGFDSNRSVERVQSARLRACLEKAMGY